MISSIELNHFRGFDALKLEGLKRVNLVVGRNNSGKTSLLEALALGCDTQRAWQTLPSLFRVQHGDAFLRYYNWLISGTGPRIASIEMCVAGKIMRLELRPSSFQQEYKFHVPSDVPINDGKFCIQRTKDDGKIPFRAMSIRPMGPEDIIKLYSNAAAQNNGEELIDSVMRSIDPRVRKVRLRKYDDGDHLMVDFGLPEMLPITQAGEGMYRLVSLLSGVFGGRPKVALLDEVDDGLHHSVLPEVWAGIAEAAELFDVQVFATTHSFECIQAAHQAFSKRNNYDFSILQLFRLKERIDGRVLQQDAIAAAIDGGIELRA